MLKCYRNFEHLILRMQQIILNPNAIAAQTVSIGKPSHTICDKQPWVETKIIDPSSSFPRGERYPIPSFFEYRINPKQHDNF